MDVKNDVIVSDLPKAPERSDDAGNKDPASEILFAAQRFIADADALEEVLQVSKPVLIAKSEEHRIELNRLVSQAKRSGQTKISLEFGELHNLVSLLAKLKRGSFLFRGHLLVALVSRFDAFVSTVARVVLSAFPDRLGKRTLTYADAAQFSSIEELRDRFIDEEIDSQMRESHDEQLSFCLHSRE